MSRHRRQYITGSYRRVFELVNKAGSHTKVQFSQVRDYLFSQ